MRYYAEYKDLSHLNNLKMAEEAGVKVLNVKVDSRNNQAKVFVESDVGNLLKWIKADEDVVFRPLFIRRLIKKEDSEVAARLKRYEQIYKQDKAHASLRLLKVLERNLELLDLQYDLSEMREDLLNIVKK